MHLVAVTIIKFNIENKCDDGSKYQDTYTLPHLYIIGGFLHTLVDLMVFSRSGVSQMVFITGSGVSQMVFSCIAGSGVSHIVKNSIGYLANSLLQFSS